MGYIYENLKLRILLALSDPRVMRSIDREGKDGMVLIERGEKDIEINYVGYPEHIEKIIRYGIAAMNEANKPVDFSAIFKQP